MNAGNKESGLIRIHPSSVVRVLAITALILVLLSIAGQLADYMTGNKKHIFLIELFFVDAEHNVPTFFSSFLLILAAFLLWVIHALEKKRRVAGAFYWAILAGGFLYVAIDESAVIHENTIQATRALIHLKPHGVFYFAWVLPAIALILVLGIFFRKFLLRLPVKTRVAFLAAAAVYLGGAVGFELIGGSYYDLHGSNNLTYSMIATVEEILEMTGMILFIRALLVYLARNNSEVLFRVLEKRDSAAPGG